MPFGEELYAGIGGRTGDAGLKYSSNQDDIRQKFTGYERDAETDLDFAQARMYAMNIGRFMAVDLGPFTVSDPQSWNRYVYVQNNPLKYIDPTGNEIYLNGSSADDFLKFLSDKSGYDLVRDVKTGKVTIKKGSKRIEKGTSKEFAKLLKSAINDSAKLNYDVQSSSNSAIFVDDGENAVVNRQKKSVSATIDFEDVKGLDQQAPELATALTSHFLFEHLKMANGSPFTGDATNFSLTSPEAGAHPNALVFEAQKIMSEFSGQTEKIRESEVVRQGGVIQKFVFYYDSVQYDVTVKATSTNAITVDKVTKGKSTKVPTYDGRRPK